MKSLINLFKIYFYCLLFVLVIFQPYSLFSQSVNIVGRVFDKDTKQPIAGVRVEIQNSNKGTYTTSSGFFRLANISVGTKLVFKSIGYEPKIIDVQQGKDSIIVYLTASVVKLQEVEKIGEIEVDEVVRRAIKQKRQNLSKLNTLQAKVYTKLFLELGGTGFETKYDSSTRRVTFSTTNRPKSKEDSLMIEFVRNFILETFSNVYIDYPRKFQYSEITQRRQTANIPKEFNKIILTDFLNFYNETVKIVNTEFVTPLSDDAFKYYHFEMLGKELYGDLYVYNIKIVPNTKLYPVFSGTMKILEKSYNILEVDVAPSDNAVIDFLDSLRYIQKFATLNENLWHPAYLELRAKIKLGLVKGLFEFGLLLRSVSIISDAIVNQPIPDSILAKSEQAVVVVSPKADSTSLEFWQNNALIETSEKEKQIYEKVDSLAKKIDTTLLRPFNQNKKFDWGFYSDIGELVGYNRVVGYSLSLSPYLEYSGFKLTASTIYSFGQKKLFYNASISFEPKHNSSSLKFSLFTKPAIISLERKMSTTLSSIFAYLFHWDYYDYFQKQGFKIEFSSKNNQVEPYSKFSLSYEHSKDSSLLKKTDRSLFSKAVWRENPQITEGDFDVLDFKFSIGSSLELFGFEIGKSSFSYKIDLNLLFGKKVNGNPFGAFKPQIELQIPTFYTGYKPMYLNLLFEYGIETKETPLQYSFRMPNAWGFGSFQTANTGLYGGRRYYAFHLQHNFSDLFWRAIGLPTYKGRGLEFSLLFSLGYFSTYGETQIYKPTTKPFVEYGFGFSRIPTFVSDFLFWGASFKFNPDRKASKGLGFWLELSFPF
ncbi:carboxypeptidase-like regulatory domain-containing protein [Bacteroidetes/Chlorobi group bacterium Naka2016]|jgi:hypothetical protein|nr:MAG: carboxypeptidase-like regulatory domain-containing protein [Bacteroidetes/Chlorobi group bacterium Naka2016]